MMLGNESVFKGVAVKERDEGKEGEQVQAAEDVGKGQWREYLEKDVWSGNKG